MRKFVYVFTRVARATCSGLRGAVRREASLMAFRWRIASRMYEIMKRKRARNSIG